MSQYAYDLKMRYELLVQLRREKPSDSKILAAVDRAQKTLDMFYRMRKTLGDRLAYKYACAYNQFLYCLGKGDEEQIARSKELLAYIAQQ